MNKPDLRVVKLGSLWAVARLTAMGYVAPTYFTTKAHAQAALAVALALAKVQQ